MLDYAHQRAREILQDLQSAILVTNGPGGLQASEFPCEAGNLYVYVLVPQTSDHLFNLEHQSEVTLVNRVWELKGEARIVKPLEVEVDLALLQKPGAEWCALVCVVPRQLQIRRMTGWGNLETLDFI